MRVGILVFPGSNCDRDCFHVVDRVLGAQPEFIWHKERHLPDLDLLIVPGGFSYGDYLRPGAIARFSPIMTAVGLFSARGGLVLGICNGFQILAEAGLLPGVLMRNRDLKFICKEVHLRVENSDLPFTRAFRPGEVIRLPIAHAEGNYYASPEALGQITRNRQIAFRYCSPSGEAADAYCPNGSIEGIAGVCNSSGNVLGMMPYPERYSEAVLGGDQGLLVFRSLLMSASDREAVHGKP